MCDCFSISKVVIHSSKSAFHRCKTSSVYILPSSKWNYCCYNTSSLRTNLELTTSLFTFNRVDNYLATNNQWLRKAINSTNSIHSSNRYVVTRGVCSVNLNINFNVNRDFPGSSATNLYIIHTSGHYYSCGNITYKRLRKKNTISYHGLYLYLLW